MRLTDTFHDLRPKDLLTPPTGEVLDGKTPVTLQRQLLASHLRLALLSGLILLLATLGVHVLNAPIQETDQQHVPMAQAAMTTQIGLHRASAALNGWVALKDPGFRATRQWAWEQEILPAMKAMESLAEQYSDKRVSDTLAALRTDLERLQKLQGWVEEVAAKPGNEPARMVFTQELMPLSSGIEALLSGITASLAASDSESSEELRNLLAKLNLAVAKSDRALGRFVVEGLDGEEAVYRQELKQQAELVTRIADATGSVPDSSLEDLQRSLATYRELGESIILSRQSPRSNVAWNTIEVRLKPLESGIAKTLEDVASREVATVTAFVGKLSRWIASTNIASIVLLVLVSGLALYLSVAAAQDLSAPIHKLSEAADHLARGHFHEPLHEEGVAEVRQLISSFNRMQHSIETSHDQLKQLALRDELTGLPNRKSFNRRIEAISESSLRHSNHFGIIVIDLDYFKEVNDSLGHDAGDELLRVFAQRLQSSVRDGDLAARIGGDEFVVVLGSLAEPSDARRVVQRIRDSVGAPVTLNGERVIPSCTMGIAITDIHHPDVDALQKKADLALYRAKRKQRGSYQFDQAVAGPEDCDEDGAIRAV